MPRDRVTRPLNGSHATAQLKADGRWIVRTMSGQRSTKSYRCPACEALVAPGTPHIVAWPDTPPPGSDSAVAGRRHWHTACWNRRP